jgi:uncharacterized protein (DUF1330 family)
MAIDPSRQDLEQFLGAPDDGEPLVMLNLLRFKEGGRARYAEYARATAPFLAQVGGTVLYVGTGETPLVAEAGQAWDAVLLVRYPNRAAFLNMVANPEYQRITQLRRDALVEAVLQPTRAFDLTS